MWCLLAIYYDREVPLPLGDNMKKELKDRLTAWMADYEDSSLLEETMAEQDINLYLLDTAFDIMYDIYREEEE